MISRRLQSKDDREASQQLYMISTIKYLGYIERGQLSQLIWGLRGQDHCKEVCIEKVVFNRGLQLQIGVSQTIEAKYSIQEDQYLQK